MTTGHSRGALVALASGMALVVSACGSDPTSTPTTAPPVVTIGLPTTTAAADAATPPGPTSIAAAAAPPDELVLPGLPALDDPVPTYSWSADQRSTREDFEALAEALGATGDVSEGVSGTDDGWSLDGDNLELMLDGGVEGAWSYSGPPPFPWPSEEEPWPTNETGEPVTIGPPPTYAAGAPLPDSYPTQDEAHALARQIVGALGLDPEAFEWRDGQRTFAAQVEAWWVIDGNVAPVKLHFGFGPEGRLVHASGQLVAPRAGPEVDRIGTGAGEERLRAEIERVRSQPTGLGNVLVGGVVAPGDPQAVIVLSEPDDPDNAATPPTTAVVHPTAAPPPVAPEMVGRIVDIEESWQVVRDESGTRLLPAYTFIEATGMRYTVSAVP